VLASRAPPARAPAVVRSGHWTLETPACSLHPGWWSVVRPQRSRSLTLGLAPTATPHTAHPGSPQPLSHTARHRVTARRRLLGQSQYYKPNIRTVVLCTHNNITLVPRRPWSVLPPATSSSHGGRGADTADRLGACRGAACRRGGRTRKGTRRWPARDL
jgi:hypothetical protein